MSTTSNAILLAPLPVFLVIASSALKSSKARRRRRSPLEEEEEDYLSWGPIASNDIRKNEGDESEKEEEEDVEIKLGALPVLQRMPWNCRSKKHHFGMRSDHGLHQSLSPGSSWLSHCLLLAPRKELREREKGERREEKETRDY